MTDMVYAPQHNVLCQLSEDLQFRVFSKDLGKAPVFAKQVGPNQFVRSAVVSGGNEVVIGTKGFDESSVELLVFDLRKMEVRKRIDNVASQAIEGISATS